ncbi:MAG: hypothetical protein NTW86_32685 [Candidatus Sumerlaeota bacterium]|nr:hypothetical protein [Candidatus Sumerlaeota bacterium]
MSTDTCRFAWAALIAALVLCGATTGQAAPVFRTMKEYRDALDDFRSSDTAQIARHQREVYEKALASPDVPPMIRGSAKNSLASLLVSGGTQPLTPQREADLQRALELTEEILKDSRDYEGTLKKLKTTEEVRQKYLAGNHLVQNGAHWMRASALAQLGRLPEAENEAKALESLPREGRADGWARLWADILSREGKSDREKAQWFLDRLKQSPETEIGASAAYQALAVYFKDEKYARDEEGARAVLAQVQPLLREYHPQSQAAERADWLQNRLDELKRYPRQAPLTPATGAPASAPASRSAADVPACSCGSGTASPGTTPAVGAQLGCGCGSLTPAPASAQ